MAQEDVTTAATEGVVSPSVSVVEELGRKAAEAEARLREKEEENAALKRQIESYHVRWLEHEIRAKALTVARLRLRSGRSTSGRSGRSGPRATILGEGAY